MNEPKKKRGRPPGSSKKFNVTKVPESEFMKAMQAIGEIPPDELKECEVKNIIFPVPVYDPFKNPRFIAKMKIKSDEK